MRYRRLVIIGAPRSGTNILRDVLTSMPGVITWPCDEINYIWRHGNIFYPSDEFTPEMATPEVGKYIRQQFDLIARKCQAHMVVEKTCANSLRVGFVDQVLPEAKYIFIRRDGFDVVGSARKRWKAEVNISYLARKALFVPFTDIPFYAFRFLWNRFYRILSREDRLAFWGPKLDGMETLIQEYTLEEVCALQWKRCVDQAAKALTLLPKECWIEVGYEAFVKEPEKELLKIMNFLRIYASDDAVARAVSNVSPRSIGKGRIELGGEVMKRLMPLLRETQTKYGYM